MLIRGAALNNNKVTGPRKLENGLVVPGSFPAFTQSLEMGQIFKKELLRVQVFCQHMDISIRTVNCKKRN